ILTRLGVVFRSERLSRKGIFCLLFWADKKVGPPEGVEGKKNLHKESLLFAPANRNPSPEGGEGKQKQAGKSANHEANRNANLQG
ncbi:MAG: hypothetical protein RIC15_07810, partial [Vicingaceae bacterium]